MHIFVTQLFGLFGGLDGFEGPPKHYKSMGCEAWKLKPKIEHPVLKLSGIVS